MSTGPVCMSVHTVISTSRWQKVLSDFLFFLLIGIETYAVEKQSSHDCISSQNQCQIFCFWGQNALLLGFNLKPGGIPSHYHSVCRSCQPHICADSNRTIATWPSTALESLLTVQRTFSLSMGYPAKTKRATATMENAHDGTSSASKCGEAVSTILTTFYFSDWLSSSRSRNDKMWWGPQNYNYTSTSAWMLWVKYLTKLIVCRTLFSPVDVKENKSPVRKIILHSVLIQPPKYFTYGLLCSKHIF